MDCILLCRAWLLKQYLGENRIAFRYISPYNNLIKQGKWKLFRNFTVYESEYNCVGLYMEKKKIIIINGPNLNLTGIREPNLYGDKSFDDLLKSLSIEFAEVEIAYFQSNVEGEIINKLHEVGFITDGIILNAGGYTHTSVAIADAVKAISSPVVEVHMSNVWARETFRHNSFISPYAVGVIAGFGMGSYRLALLSLLGNGFIS